MEEIISSGSSSSDEISFVKEKRAPIITEEDYLITCSLCKERFVQHILIPCHHCCLCDICYDNMVSPRICPICNEIISRTEPVIIINEQIDFSKIEKKKTPRKFA